MSRRRAFLVAIVAPLGAILSFTASTCHTQWVDVSNDGGVYVRAPFVRVHVDRYGGTSVRAPFTAVDVPGRGYPDAQLPIVIERVQPSSSSAQELAVMDDEALWELLRATAERLHERLARFDTGDSWQRYLQLPDGVLSDSSSDSRQRLDALTKLLDRFRHVTREPRYAKISGLAAFDQMQAALTEAVSRPDVPAAVGNITDEELPPPQSDGAGRGR
jgi:hypothetical protein